MEKSPQAPQPAPQDRAAWRTLGRLLPFLAPYRMRVLLAAGSLLVAAGATLVIPLVFRLLIDEGFVVPEAASANSIGTSTRDVNFAFIALFGLALVLAASTALRFYCVSWLGDRITADLRKAVFARVLRQDPVFFETLRTGEVLSRLSSDTTLIQTLVGSSLSLGLRNVLLFIGALIMMLWTSPVLASVIVALLVLVVLPIIIFGRRVRKLSRTSQDRLADSGALASETLNAMQTVQSYVRENMETERYSKSADDAFVSAVQRNRSRSILTAVAIALIFGSIVIVLWIGAQAVMDGRMSGGLLLQFMLYAALVAGSTGALAEVIGDVQRAAGAIERLLELMEAEPSIVSVQPTAPISAATGETSITADATSIDKLRSQAITRVGTSNSTTSSGAGASVQFDRVCFSYPSRPAESALDDFSFTVDPGETVALVGPSGAGKTTVLQLLLRFYDPLSGEIRFDGTALVDQELSSLRESIGFVSQESVVFSDSVEANIRYGRLDATEEQIRQAAMDAQAHDFIERLPEGYSSYLGERGVRLSGGQKQRLSIARALLKNPPLLLLDEATSALDAESERKVQMALERAMLDRTTIVIAHRLATIVNADRILVMDEGRLVESGTHAQLLEQSGLYARLAAMQFGLDESSYRTEMVGT